MRYLDLAKPGAPRLGRRRPVLVFDGEGDGGWGAGGAAGARGEREAVGAGGELHARGEATAERDRVRTGVGLEADRALDLPGAKVTYGAVVYTPGPTRKFIHHDTLAPDRPEPPVVTGASTPAHGALVHAGQTITVHITATEPTNDGPQEGIHDIQLIGPDGLIKSKDYGTHPIACDKSRLSKELTATYTVPNNPPATIKLTAIAHDFVSRERTLSASFPTGGQVWNGTFDLEQQPTKMSPRPAGRSTAPTRSA